MFGDCHMHIFMNGTDYKAAVHEMLHGDKEAVVRRHLAMYKEVGVTFLRDGGDHYGASILARELASEYGITYRTPAFAIYKNGHYGKVVGRGFDTMKEYENLVKEAVSQNADFIKIMVSGIVDFDHNCLTEEGITDEEILEMTRIAHDYGKSVMAHANGSRIVKAAAEAGIDSVEHGYFMNKDAIDAMASNGTIYVPTVSTVRNLTVDGRFDQQATNALWEDQKRVISRCYELGVPMALGSDAGAYRVLHGQGVRDEWKAFVEVFDSEEIVNGIANKGEQLIRNKF